MTTPTQVAVVVGAVAAKTTITTTKQLWILRHGQAHHNVRAEAKRQGGCSYQEFLDWMQQDDCLDADLTEMGEQQARQHCPSLGTNHQHYPIELVVSSPLSRALRTADLAFPPVEQPQQPQPALSSTTTTTTISSSSSNRIIRRICKEDFREVNGWLENAKRRSISDLQQRFLHWDFTELDHEHDMMWTPTLECTKACAERGYQGLRWIMARSEQSILLVSHGGLLRYTMTEHSHVQLRDGRQPTPETVEQQQSPTKREVASRFNNGELRRFQVSWEGEEESRPIITLTEIDPME